MFQTFSGSSKRPRQVNLSGRNNDPFAAINQPSNQSSSAVKHAKEERKARQLEREKLHASKIIYRELVAYSKRSTMLRRQRLAWDRLVQDNEADADADADVDMTIIISGLLEFANPKQNRGDVQRVITTCGMLVGMESSEPSIADTRSPAVINSIPNNLLMSFAKLALHALDTYPVDFQPILQYLQAISISHAAEMATFSIHLCVALIHTARHHPQRTQVPVDVILRAILNTSGITATRAHDGITYILRFGWLSRVIHLGRLAKVIDADRLALSTAEYLRCGPVLCRETTSDMLGSVWTLAHYLYLHKAAKATGSSSPSIPTVHIDNLTELINQIASYGETDLNVVAEDVRLREGPFVQEQIKMLVDKDNLGTCLEHLQASLPAHNMTDSASSMASYFLTLLQSFPNRSDDIRMRVYLQNAQVEHQGTTETVPAIKFFWEAVTESEAFIQISKDPRNAIIFLNPQKMARKEAITRGWKTCLLFFELYSFALKIMDDDEFMSGGRSDPRYQSFTRQSVLPIYEIRRMIIFMKNLVYALYFKSIEIQQAGSSFNQSRSLGGTLGASADNIPSVHRSDTDPCIIKNLRSSSINYVRGTVTSLLRMLYERDSRRSFVDGPDGWLMSQIQMDGLIETVLAEQRYKAEHDDNDDNDDDDEETERIDERSPDENINRDMLTLVGTNRINAQARRERIRKQQFTAETKRRRLTETLPMLSILENLPFFIPFDVRVKILRTLVKNDQERRRNGADSEDAWRIAMENARGVGAGNGEVILRSRSAVVRRDNVMDDAYEQLYALGEGLKEPLQVTFVDQFGANEAGIDGGGVTKELLTSISEEAFKTSDLQLFKENKDHLLYPNPILIDQKQAQQSSIEHQNPASDSQQEIKDILQRYEFVGRIVGKCLYEGILIDVHFAPFFLVKWALTGGKGSATHESGYRANINDLRALDEDLYKGLLNLKSYRGDAEELGLNFTITDDLASEDLQGDSAKITKDLIPNGSDIPVTNNNKLMYIAQVARYRLQTQPQKQTRAFLQGLSTMIDPGWLSMFNSVELQTLVAGDECEIDVADLRRNTTYAGVYSIGYDGLEHPTIKLFWEVIQEISDVNRRKLLKYVTSTPRAPLLGFSQLKPRFCIRDSGSDQQRLPSTSTCVNLMKLPIYRTKDVLKEKLLYAIDSGAGFDLS